jgi:hypothetical protein
MKAAGAAGATAALGISADPVAAVPVEEDDITKEDALDDIEYGLEHPRVYHSPDELEVARRNVESTDWGSQLEENVLETANIRPFVEMDNDTVAAARPVVAPDGNSYYSWPFGSGDLEKGTKSPVDGSELSIAGYDQPGEVVDESGNVFPGTVDGVELDDEGDGVVVDPDEVPSDWAAADLDEPTTFHLVARYNGIIAKNFSRASEPIAYAYAVTGEQQYADTLAAILDGLAEAVSTSFDWVVDKGPYGWFDPPERKPAVLHRHMYTFARLVQWYANAADLVWDSGALDADSWVAPGTSIKQHVAEDLFVESADWCWRGMHGGYAEKGLEHANYARIFHNGTTDYNKAILAVSSLLNLDVGYAEWALDGQVSLQSFLGNSLFRDGTYYETSSLYSVTYDEYAELAYHLETDTYPDGVDVYSDPQFVNANVYGPMRQSVAGRIPRYGDVSSVDTMVTTDPLLGDFEKALQFYARADGETQDEYAQLLAQIEGGDPNNRIGAGHVGEYDTWEAMWSLFNIDGEISGFDLSSVEVEPRDSELLGGKGLAMLRPEQGFDRGAMVRYGTALSHGHADQLGMHVYGAGRELSYDPGKHPDDDFMKSFNKQTVAHNTVAVNEEPAVSVEHDGGSVNYFSTDEGYSVADVSDPAAYAHEDVDEYRRTTALIDTADDQSYLFDVFRVAGAEQSDFSFHGGGVGFDTDLDPSATGDASVAFEDTFWGDKVDSHGNVEGYGDESRANVPPGNGYGFLGQPRKADGSETWSATWSVEREDPPASLRLTMLGEDDRDVVVANAPDPTVENLGVDADDHDLEYVLARDEASTSQFVSVIEAVGEEFPVASVEELDVPGHDDATFAPVAAKVTLADGRTDYFLSTLEGEEFTAHTGDGGRLNTDAEFATVRVAADGTTIESVQVENGSHLHARLDEGRPLVVDADADSVGGSVVDVDYETPSLLVDADLPTDGSLAGRYVTVDAPEYSHNSPYLVESVESEGSGSRITLVDTSMDLSRGSIVEKDGDVITSPVSFPFTETEGGKYHPADDASEYFDGKLLLDEQGDSSTVADVKPSYRDVELADATAFDVGDRFIFYDVKDGDAAAVATSVSVRRSDGSYEVESTTDVDVVTPRN